MKIWELTSENFKKLNVRLALNGKSITVTGDNETGKSTFIDAVFKTLTGEKIKGEPVQLGKDKARNKIVIRKDDGSSITVERTFGDKQTLTVKLNNTSKVTSPQKFLDETLGQISFDPLQFVNMTPLEQKRFLMQLLKIDLSEFEDKKRELLDELDSTNKDLNKLEKDLDSLPLAEKEYKFIDPSEVITESERINELRLKAEKLKTEQGKEQDNIQRCITFINEWFLEIEKLNVRIKELRTQIENAENDIKLSKSKVDELHDDLLEINVPEPSSLEEKMKEIQLNNDYYKAQQERKTKEREYEQVEITKTDIQAKIKKLEKDRTAKLNSVQMPIEGLEIIDNGLRYQGLALTEDNVSTSRIIEIGIRIAIALNPHLRILQIKDGSLLGSGMLETIKAICKENDYQLFVERVTDDKEIGFVIEEEKEPVE